MVRTVTIIALLISLLACERENSDATLIVQGVLIADKTADGFRVSLIEDFSQRPIRNASVAILSENGDRITLDPHPDEEGRYFDADGSFIPQAGQAYQLEVIWQDHRLNAETVIPLQIEPLQVSATTIPVDPVNPGQPVFSVLWTDPPGIAQVLTLDVLETEPEAIPFEVPAGQFDERYSVPVAGQGTTLFDTDFEVYGAHTLTVYAVDEAYESVFFYQPGESGSLLTSGPENILGGGGYFASATQLEISIEIIE